MGDAGPDIRLADCTPVRGGRIGGRRVARPAAVAVAASNAAMFLYRTITGQYYYRTIPNIGRTVSGFLLALAAAAVGVVFYQHFVIKFVLVGAILFIYCTLYRPQLQKLWQMGLGLLRKLLAARRQ